MKQLPKALFAKSLDSLVLAIEHFNRPWDRGRHEAVLILLDRAFELLLKSLILHQGGKIREPYEKKQLVSKNVFANALQMRKLNA